MSDDLLKRLEKKVEVWSETSLYGQAAARIRELTRQLEAADKHAISIESILSGVSSWDGKTPTHVVVSADRIRELEAQVAAQKALLDECERVMVGVGYYSPEAKEMMANTLFKLKCKMSEYELTGFESGWECPIGRTDCTRNCGSYGCDN